MPLTTILFDHDGTLVDSETSHYQMWAEVLAPFNVSLTAAQYKQLYAGIPTTKNAIDIVTRFSLSVDPENLVDAKNSLTHGYLDRQPFPLMPGVRGILNMLRSQGLRVGIVTGAGREGVEVTLRDHELENYFDLVVSGDDVEVSKPAPDCYLKAMHSLGVDPAECLAIEDTENGLRAATAADLSCLAIPNPMSDHHNFESAAAVVKNMEEAQRWIVSRL